MPGNLSNSTNDSVQNNLTQHSDMDAGLFIYILPVIIIIGTISNGLTLIVFIRGKQQTSSVSFYFCVYSIANLLNLYFSFGLSWLSAVSDLGDIETTMNLICSLYQFLYRILSYTGLWIVLAMTIDRYIAVCNPHHAPTMCSVFMAKVVTIIIYTGLIVVSIHAMWTYQIVTDTNSGKSSCNIEALDKDLHAQIWLWFSASCYIYIPLILLILFDVMLICGICIRGRGSDVSTQECVSTDLRYTVLALSNLYLLLACPMTIINILDYTIDPNYYMTDPEFKYRFLIARQVADFLAIGNTVTPGFLCCMFSRNFRQDLFQIFCSLWQVKARNRNHEMKAVSTGSSVQLDLDNCVENTLV